MPFSNFQPVYDFEANDEFLNTISGAIPSLSPALLTGEDTQTYIGKGNANVTANSDYLDPNIDYMNPNLAGDEISPTSGWIDPLEQVLGQQPGNFFNNQQHQQQFFQLVQDQGQGQQGFQIQHSNQPQPLFDSNILHSERKSASLSTNNSGYHSVASNVLSPVSNNSITSADTSPEYAPFIKQEDDKKVDHNITSDDNASTHSSNSNSNLATSKKNPKSISNINGKKGKCSHNMIEKKYRTNINSKILALRDAVPSLRIAIGDSKDMSIADLEGLTPASKLNKASVLTKATEYIKHLEKKNDILKNQNRELQRIIQEANANQLQQHHQMPMGMHQMGQNMQPQHSRYSTNQGFGFVPNMHDQSYNTTVNNNPQVPVAFGNNFVPQQPHQQQLSTGQKVLLGGLATVMGTSLFSGGDGDYRGLSSIPILPILLKGAKSSHITGQIFGLLKNLILFGAIVNILYPYFIPVASHVVNEESDGKTSNNFGIYKLWKEYFSISYGFQLPNVINEGRKNEILSRLHGKSSHPYTAIELLNDYIYLSSCELKFENCFLNLIVGKLLISKIPILSHFIELNLSIKLSIIVNLEYKSDDINLIKLNHLIHDLDRVSIFGSETLFKRLLNLSEQRQSINWDIYDGLDRLKYVELYQDQINSYYGIIFAWRILELSHQLNLKYLDILSKDGFESNEELFTEIQNDTEGINKLLNKDEGDKVRGSISTKLKKHFNLFKTVIAPEKYALELKHEIHNDVEKYISNFKILTESQELIDIVTLASEKEYNKEEQDEEVIHNDETLVDNDVIEENFVDNGFVEENEDEDFVLDDEDLEDDDGEENTHFENNLSNQKALISSLNLVSQDQFIILTSALVLYYNQENSEQATKLLEYFFFPNDEIELSYFSFTILLQVILKLSSSNVEHSEILDKLVRIVRIWIHDSSRKEVLSMGTRGDLTELVVKKGMLLNGITEENNDVN